MWLLLNLTICWNIPGIPHYSFACHTADIGCDVVSSDNVTGGENQQETACSRQKIDASWVVGFVDGEGCFSVSVHRNPFVRRTRGWQLSAAFQVYQHEDHRSVLNELVGFFGCGVIHPKGPNSRVITYSVQHLRELDGVIVPFFEHHQLHVKDQDFRTFAYIVKAMRGKEHLAEAGFERLIRMAYGMNANGKQRSRTLEVVLAGSSETARQAPLAEGKIQSDLHGDMQSQAEMSWPVGQQ